MKKWWMMLSMLFITAPAVRAQYDHGCGMMGGYYGWGGMFMGLLFLIVIILAIYFIIQALKPRGTIGREQEKPIDILKRRYAKGEITKEQFDQMKKDLES
jgi:putative membrane protein